MADEKKKMVLTLTFDPETLIVAIDMGTIPAPEIALNILAQAKREIDFQWSVRRGMQEQQRMMAAQQASQLIRRH